MIPYERSDKATLPISAVKLIGLGGAGCNMLERMALDGIVGADLLALNTDSRALGSCIAAKKIQLGASLTKGLGAGGDPDLGHQAVLEAETELRAALKGRNMVFLCAGLGGGTGSGAAPIVTRIAREEGAFVVVFATMPFAFEGRRRRDQAESALNELAVLANTLVTFDNNRMGELVLAQQGIHEAFAEADQLIRDAIQAVLRIVTRPGLINIGLDELMSALRTTRSRCLFGSGMAEGKDRCAKALRAALASPLLDQGSLLKDAQSVIVHLCGGSDLTLFEIELLMQNLAKSIPESAHVMFGAAIDPEMGNKLGITLISALPEDALSQASRESLSRVVKEDADQDTSPANEADQEPKPPTESNASHASSQQSTPKANLNEAAKTDDVRAGGDDETPLLFEDVEAAPTKPSSQSVDKEDPATITEPESNPVLHDSDEELDTSIESASDEMPPITDQAPEDVPQPRGETESATMLAEFVAVHENLDEDLEQIPTAEAADDVESEIPPTSPPVSDDSDGSSDEPEVGKNRAPWSKAKKTQLKPPASGSSDSPKVKLGIKAAGTQSELSLDSTPRGRFEGENPNVYDGEDLDLPPFLRSKK